ncbi:MAG TPA: hypothetical protein VIJ94_07570 [Caulobacteraceae bacterium]
MAKIIKHPEVEDYFVELTLDEIRSKPNGIIPEYEANRLVVLKDYRLPVDLEALGRMSTDLSRIEDQKLRRKIKKLTSTWIVEDQPDSRDVRQAVFEVMCGGDEGLFRAVRSTMAAAHQAIIGLYDVCFPNYKPFMRLIPSVRLTQTLFENLHWDNHQIEDDFQQVRIFCNLDQRPRIWNVSHNFVEFAKRLYEAHDLGRYAGKDPNLLNDYICGNILGGTAKACTDDLPRHAAAFEPGEVWFGESRMIAHQIYYGERAMVYMFFVPPEAMLDPARRFNIQVKDLHRAFSRPSLTPVG